MPTSFGPRLKHWVWDNSLSGGIVQHDKRKHHLHLLPCRIDHGGHQLDVAVAVYMPSRLHWRRWGRLHRYACRLSGMVCCKPTYSLINAPLPCPPRAACPVNTFKPLLGPGSCTQCVANSGTASSAAVAASQCVCSSSYYGSGDTSCSRTHL